MAFKVISVIYKPLHVPGYSMVVDSSYAHLSSLAIQGSDLGLWRDARMPKQQCAHRYIDEERATITTHQFSLFVETNIGV